jgi:glutamate dehydrogenase
VETRARAFLEAGAPEALARAVANLGTLRSAVVIADLARDTGETPEAAARLFHAVGAALGFDRLRGEAAALNSGDGFERRAARQLIVQMVAEQSQIAHAVHKAAPGAAPDAAIAAWTETRKAAVDRAHAALEEIEAAGDWSFAKLTLAHAALAEAA